MTRVAVCMMAGLRGALYRAKRACSWADHADPGPVAGLLSRWLSLRVDPASCAGHLSIGCDHFYIFLSLLTVFRPAQRVPPPDRDPRRPPGTSPHASPAPPAPVAPSGTTIGSRAAGRYWPCGPPGPIYWPCGPPGQYEPGPAAGHPRCQLRLVHLEPRPPHGHRGLGTAA